MSRQMLRPVIAVLALAITGQGTCSAASGRNEAAKRSESPGPSLKEWRDEVRKELFRGGPFPSSRFDKIFDDDFFGKDFDPFAEIERFQRRFSSIFEDEGERSLFGRSWRRWFDDRMGLGGLKTKTERKDGEVIVTLGIPGLKDQSLDIDINHDRMRVSYSVRSVRKDEDASGRFRSRSESVSRYRKIMPIPLDADPDTARIEKGKDSVRIVFKQRKGAPRREKRPDPRMI